MEDKAADRALLLTALATFLFVGGLRGFLSSVYYQNLAALELGVSALFALLLLAPLLFFLPPLQRRPRAMLLVGALALAAGRVAQPFSPGSALHVPLSGLAAAGFLVLLGGLLLCARDERTPRLVAIGVAIGWALDVALVWFGDSADPTSVPTGLLLVAPAALALLVLALGVREDTRGTGEGAARGRAWLAGAALGGWLFLENAILGNPYAAARWDAGSPAVYAPLLVLGLLAGAALLAFVRSWQRSGLVVLHALLLAAIVDHPFVHTRAAPGLVAAAPPALVVDAALLLRALARGSAGRALVATGLVTLALHFLFAFTFQFEYVPGGHVWKGQELALLPGAALLVALGTFATLRMAPISRAPGPTPRRPVLVAIAAPLMVAIAAVATPAAAVVEPDDDALAVMSFNLHQGFANDGVLDPTVYSAVLDEAQPDVIVIQEGDSPRFTSGNLDVLGYLAARHGYHLAYGQPTREQAFGGAILSRHPIAEWRAIQLPSASDNRFYTEARLDVGGRDVWLYSVHLALPHEDRMAQTREILAQAATHSGPTILAGDFNSCPIPLCPDYAEGVPDDVYATITARYQDAWAALGRDPNDANATSYPETGVRIDYVFVSAEFAVVDAGSIRTSAALAASDHLPVVATLRLA